MRSLKVILEIHIGSAAVHEHLDHVSYPMDFESVFHDARLYALDLNLEALGAHQVQNFTALIQIFT